MKSNIFVPKTITVGFQKRSDTYTGKLAYVIYTDSNGKLRKEASWNSWRDSNIESEIYDNTPMSGFVLNKKVGDYNSGWNHRQAYTRVYDSRGFEFEITIENLLYILENTSSIKGKGLEGEFIYGWDGKDLVLLPTCSPDYKKIEMYSNKIQNNEFIKAKDLKIGATYLTKQNEELVYMGKFDYYSDSWRSEKGINKGKYHFFASEYRWRDEITWSFYEYKSISQKLISVINEDCRENYAELFELLECKTSYSPLDESKNEYILYTLEDFKKRFNDCSWGYYYIDKVRREISSSINGVVCYSSEDGCWGYSYNNSKFENLDEAYEKLKPCYLRQYLKNGKLYRSEKYE